MLNVHVKITNAMHVGNHLVCLFDVGYISGILLWTGHFTKGLSLLCKKKRFIYVNLAYIIIYFNFSILKLVYCPSINNIDRFWTKKQHEMKHSTTYVNGF